MEKLVTLLNEYESEKHKAKGCGIRPRGKIYLECADRFLVISKWYGFIGWLLLREHIKKDKLFILIKAIGGISTSEFTAEEILLMLLSFKSDPIKYLVDMLEENEEGLH